ncbi:hypothetical protein BN903_77 [Halorubrum sp. AJ67]|nr:hypothetical protein BN903_77 [Halorubrum sp. AJ67]
MVRVLLDDERPPPRPAVDLLVRPHPVAVPLQPFADEVVRGGLDVAHRDEVVVEVVALRLLCARVLLADPEPDRPPQKRHAVRGPAQLAHLVRLRGGPADVLPGHGHPADVHHEVRVGHVGVFRPVVSELVDGVVGDPRLGDAGVDERARRVPGVRREVRRNAEVGRLVDVAVDDSDGEVGRVGREGAAAGRRGIGHVTRGRRPRREKRAEGRRGNETTEKQTRPPTDLLASSACENICPSATKASSRPAERRFSRTRSSACSLC